MSNDTEPGFPMDPEAGARLGKALDDMIESARSAALRAGESLRRVGEMMQRAIPEADRRCTCGHDLHSHPHHGCLAVVSQTPDGGVRRRCACEAFEASA